MATIVVFSPHNDDHALAMGGTIAMHLKRGDTVETFIGSFGEMSHPHLKPEVIRKTRVKEAQRADKEYGGTGRVQFLGLRELKFAEDFKRKGFPRKIAARLRELQPERIYIPAPDDMHPDHKALGTLVLDVLSRMQLKPDVYAYYVYPRFVHMKAPRLVVDVSKFYSQKLDGLAIFRSQIKFFTYAFTTNLVYLYHLIQNGVHGFLRGVRFAETFYKVR